MYLTLRLHQSLQLTQRQTLSLPSPNWSAVNAVNDIASGTARPCTLRHEQLDLTWLPLRTRLERIDAANALFRYDYKIEDSYGPQVFYRIPLMRGYNLRIEDIRERIPRLEYTHARDAIMAAGPLERIVRAVPYGDLHDRIVAHLAEKHQTLDDIVLVGIDRGGRIPTILAKAALGRAIAWFLKVDQGGLGANTARLAQLAGTGVFHNKYIVFIDSTVDSGRQIRHLASVFDDPATQREYGHRGWVVVGSNENGNTLEHHLNVNWGVDPDTTFEDDPRLMGVDYGSNTVTVQACASKTSSMIRQHFLRVVRGDTLCVSKKDLTELQTRTHVDKTLERAVLRTKKSVQSAAWQQRPQRIAAADLSVPGRNFPVLPRRAEPIASLAIIGGSHAGASLTVAQRDYLLANLVPDYRLHFGTERGLPGALLAGALHQTAQPAQIRVFLRPHAAASTDPSLITRTETSLEGHRHTMIANSDFVLMLDGEAGTLMEAEIARALNKPIIAIKGFGHATQYLERGTHQRPLHVVPSLRHAIRELHSIARAKR